MLFDCSWGEEELEVSFSTGVDEAGSKNMA